MGLFNANINLGGEEIRHFFRYGKYLFQIKKRGGRNLKMKYVSCRDTHTHLKDNLSLKKICLLFHIGLWMCLLIIPEYFVFVIGFVFVLALGVQTAFLTNGMKYSSILLTMFLSRMWLSCLDVLLCEDMKALALNGPCLSPIATCFSC